MNCQRCKTARSTSSSSIGSLAGPGVKETASRSFRLCEACRRELTHGPSADERCTRCGGPGSDGCGQRAVVDGSTVCLDCWWPTHLTDAPVEVTQVVDDIDRQWRDMREMVESIEQAIAAGQLSNLEKMPDWWQGIRLHTVILMAETERLKGGLSPEAKAFVERYVGPSPYPTMQELLIEMHPDQKDVIEGWKA